MTSSGPRVRDLTTAEPRLEVGVASGEALETVSALFVFASCRAKGCDEFEVGREWYDDLAGRLGQAAVADLAAVPENAWLALVGPAVDLPEPRRVDDLAAWMEGADPGEILGELMSCPDHPELHQMDPAEMRDRMVGTLRAFAVAAPVDWERVGPVLERDADHKRMMARTMDPERLVEWATSGVTFAPGPEVSRVVLVPSVALRPWVTITEHRGLRVFTYPVADEHLDADPDAPPTWLVDVYKALGDERRLRILGVLAAGPAGLAEITRRVDLAKSTVHHHLRVLRTAGLVRVTVGDDKEYSLRTDAVPEAGRLLEAYLGAGDEMGARR